MAFFAVFAALSASPSAHLLAQSPPPELSADAPIAFDADEDLLLASGNAVFRDANTTVEADEIRFFRSEGRILASGNVRVSRVGLRLLTESLEYNIAARTVKSGPFKAGYPPVFMQGAAFEGSMAAIEFAAAELFLREPATGSPRLKADGGTWLVDTGIRTRDLHFNLPFGLQLPLPALAYDFGSPTIDADLQLGYRSTLGAFARSTLLFPVAPTLNAGANLDLYSNRGVLIGPALALTYPGLPGHHATSLSTAWIRDHNDRHRGNDVFANPIGEDRFFIDLTTQHRSASNRHQLQARLTRLSDSEMLRDFRPGRFFPLYQPDAFADYTFQHHNLLLNAFARGTPNDFYGVVERLPELKFEWLPTTIAHTGILLNAQAAFTRYRAVLPAFAANAPAPSIVFPSNAALWTPSAAAQQWFHRSDALAVLSRPFHFSGPAKGWSLTPRFATRWLYYDARAPQSAAEDFAVSEFGIDLAYRFSATFPNALRRFNIIGLRHLATLSASARFRSIGDHAASPPLDVTFYRPGKPILNLEDLFSLDDIPERHHLRLAFQNAFVARSANNSATRRFVQFDLFQDWNLEPARGEDSLDASYIEAMFEPFHGFRLRWLHKFAGDALRSEATFVSASLASADLWQLNFTSEILQGAIDQLTIDGRYRLSENLDVFAAWQFDRRSDTLTEQRYGFGRRFAHSWLLDAYVTLSEDNARESSFSFGLRLTWLSF